MSEKLEITKEKVLEAAASCNEAKSVLKVLFPEAFKEDINLLDSTTKNMNIYRHKKYPIFIEIRNFGELAHKAFWLSHNVNWELKKDLGEELCLIPTLK